MSLSLSTFVAEIFVPFTLKPTVLKGGILVYFIYFHVLFW